MTACRPAQNYLAVPCSGAGGVRDLPIDSRLCGAAIQPIHSVDDACGAPAEVMEGFELTTAIPNLWPEDIADVKTTPPLTILRTQASNLDDKTGMLVRATIESVAERTNSFMHSFLLVAPSLGNYTTRLFRVRHGVHFYPLEILTDLDGPNFRAASQEDLVRALAEIFRSPPVKKMVQSLIAQSRALEAAPA